MSNPLPGNPSDSTIDKVTLGMIVSSLQRRQEKKSRQAHSQQQQAQSGKDAPERVRLVFQIDPLLLGRLQVQADRLGLTLGEYLSQAATRRLESDEAADPAIAKKKKPNPPKKAGPGR